MASCVAKKNRNTVSATMFSSVELIELFEFWCTKSRDQKNDRAIVIAKILFSRSIVTYKWNSKEKQINDREASWNPRSRSWRSDPPKTTLCARILAIDIPVIGCNRWLLTFWACNRVELNEEIRSSCSPRSLAHLSWLNTYLCHLLGNNNNKRWSKFTCWSVNLWYNNKIT